MARDQIIILSEVLAQLQEEGQAHADAISRKPIASIAFLDYIAAFDSVDHAFLDEALHRG